MERGWTMYPPKKKKKDPDHWRGVAMYGNKSEIVGGPITADRLFKGPFFRCRKFIKFINDSRKCH